MAVDFVIVFDTAFWANSEYSFMAEMIRPVTMADNPQVSDLIKTVMTEFGCVGAGYSIADPEVDAIFQAYQKPGHKFWVIADRETILGCGGIGTLDKADDNVCELKKMYFFAELRGKGFGRKLIELCLNEAKMMGYRKCYIETVARMTSAIRLYEKTGFKKLESPLGNTGHGGCDTFYMMELK